MRMICYCAAQRSNRLRTPTLSYLLPRETVLLVQTAQRCALVGDQAQDHMNDRVAESHELASVRTCPLWNDLNSPVYLQRRHLHGYILIERETS